MASILETLEREAGPDGQASAQVFLRKDIDRDRLESMIQEMVDEAVRRVGGSDDHPTIERVSRLAKSFSLVATPTIFSAIAATSEVVAILPSKIDDIYPKPTDDN